jgi:serine/threonine protein kinase/tetratricopeptide (TPR) repeat protein
VGDLRDQLQANLADRYVLERELGRGGMATVYLAHDLRHDRPVALKVLHPDLAHALGPERFLREIKLAARLQHPHILSVHDSGETAGHLWFTMPYVEGESLRDWLKREKQLPVEDGLRITTEAARALHYAHQHGVIHRDVKPENILLTRDGTTLLADFGIGRALGMPAPGERLTETGVVVGTPVYMSPEQATGERVLDGRTDIYSLGVVLYEMLAGEPPYTGPTAQAIIARRFSGEVPNIRRLRPAVPEAVEQAVLKALAPVPADRFQTAAEFARALAGAARGTSALPQPPPPSSLPAKPRRGRPGIPTALAFGLGLVAMASMGMLLWQRSHRATEPSAGGPKRLAVLPFQNIGRAEEEYFADGITEAVRGKLTALPGLRVTARSSSNEYKKTTEAPQQIGQELGVKYLLTGTVRWEKRPEGTSRVQVTPELIQVTTAEAKWQQPFDASVTDVFQVQADIAGRVAEALNLALGASEREQLAEKPTQNLAAYDAYLKGEETAQGIWGVNPATLHRAADYYEQAVALDSGFVLAWAQLSRVLSYAYFNGTPSAADADRARSAADRAVALSPNRVEGRIALGDYYRYIKADFAQALEQYTQGQRRAPNNADLLTGMALAQQGSGKWAEAVGYLQKAVALDPRSITAIRRLAFTQLWLRRYPEALEASDRALALGPTNLQALETKAMTHLAQEDLEAARRVIRAVPVGVEPTALVAYLGYYWDLFWLLDEEQQRLLLRLTPSAFDNRWIWGLVLAQTYAHRGDQARARAYADSARLAFEEQLKLTPEDAQVHVLYGLALAYLGRKVQAVKEGERGLALRPVTKDAYQGAYIQHQLARIYLLVGEPEKALDRLEPLLKIPYYLSPGWLKIDPNFAPLRGNRRFERLVNGS